MGDIVIKSMEMPKEGEVLYIAITSNGVVGRALTSERHYMPQKEGVKAVELPEHEDLISKQKTVKSLMEVMCAGCKHTDDCSWCSMAEYREIVENAPAVLEASK